ncbi:UNKNOWN [Stylonychia lemnae]|uniref:Uncharacterized protein n=1 Tax=Stylonychia lemnae TaxID=5949 RepID=A0A078AA21_STYLE|nr:UNKNOWN [Stylonychia lemnae]|eukprot:CDW79039.1 UNKNOWN [Stylonychia lemnae]
MVESHNNCHGHNHGTIDLEGLDDHYNINGQQLPQTCDVKEQLILKMQQLDMKIFQLIKSNKEIMKELADDPEMPEYIQENEGIIIKSKDDLILILNAFIKSGIDLDKEVLPQLEHKNLWLNDDKLNCNTNGLNINQNQENNEKSDVQDQYVQNQNTSQSDDLNVQNNEVRNNVIDEDGQVYL